MAETTVNELNVKWRGAAQAGVAGGVIGLVALVPLVIFFALSAASPRGGPAGAFGTANDVLNLVSALLLVAFVLALWHALPGRDSPGGRVLMGTGVALQVASAAGSLATISGRWGLAAVVANGIAVLLFAAWVGIAADRAGRDGVISPRLARFGILTGAILVVGAIAFGATYALPSPAQMYLQLVLGVPGFAAYCALPLWVVVVARRLASSA